MLSINEFLTFFAVANFVRFLKSSGVLRSKFFCQGLTPAIIPWITLGQARGIDPQNTIPGEWLLRFELISFAVLVYNKINDQ